MRNQSLWMAASSILLAVVAGGCTSSNPGYTGGDDLGSPDQPWQGDTSPRSDRRLTVDAGHRDAVPPGKDLKKPDLRAPYDSVPWPDSVPWQCKTAVDCDDKLACTDDVCNAQKKCQHTLQTGHCLLGGATCAAEGDADPTNSCRTCQPGKSTQSWTTLGDGAPCASDGHSCTNDVCKGGTCSHDLTVGFCMVNGICHADGWSGNDPCNECITAKSTSALTFVAGKPCTAFPAGQLGGMCWQNKCSAWAESILEPKGSKSSALNAVAPIATALFPETWAAGEYIASNGVTAGTLVRVSSGVVAVPPVMATLRFTGIHFRMAVGDGGQAYYHNGVAWAQHTKLQTTLNGSNRAGVWGAAVAGTELFWLSGFEGGGSSGMLLCDIGVDPVTCDAQTGFQQNAQLGPIAGTAPGGSGLGATWAVPTNAAADIYYYAPSATSWIRGAPQGCQDLGSGGGTPCSGTSQTFVDVFASGPTDVWAVGTGGLLLHSDGTGWKLLSAAVSYQSSYSLDAVFSSPPDNLVTIAGHAVAAGGRWVSLFNYNTDLGRWFGPITLVGANNNPNDQIRDLGGSGYANLYAVGTRLGGGSATPHMVAWSLQLK